MEVAGMNRLPPETIVSHILPYLRNVDVMSLAKSNGRLLRMLSRCRIYHLWPRYNKQYLESAAFREEVARTIPTDRLVLTYEPSEGQSVDLSALAGVHWATVDLPSDAVVASAADLSPLQRVRVVELWLPDNFSGAALSPLAATADVRIHNAPADCPEFCAAQRVELDGSKAPLSCVASAKAVIVRGCTMPDGTPLTGVSALAKCAKVELGNLPALQSIDPLAAVKTLVLSDCPKIRAGCFSTLNNLRSLTWRNSILTDVPVELVGLSFLDLSDSPSLVNVANAGAIHTVILSRCPKLADISSLGGVHMLDVSDSGKGSDGSHSRQSDNARVFAVDNLGTVHTLRLDGCKVKGVKCLGTVYSLSLSGCVGVTDDDVSQLGRVHTLNVSVTGVTNVSALGNVHTLYLMGCMQLKDVSTLGGCDTLNLAYSANVEDVSALGRVTALNVSSTMVSDVSALGGVTTLSLRDCRDVSDVSALGGVTSLDIRRTAVTDVSMLGGVYRLYADHCRIADVSALGHVHELSLGFTLVTDVSMLGHVHSLNLEGCKVSNVSALGNVHTLVIDMCPVTDASALDHVCILSAKGCPIVDKASIRVSKLVV